VQEGAQGRTPPEQRSPYQSEKTERIYKGNLQFARWIEETNGDNSLTLNITSRGGGEEMGMLKE